LKRAPTNHVCDRLEASRTLELERRYNSIPYGKSKETPSISLRDVHK
jgi:hypothetical protein